MITKDTILTHYRKRGKDYGWNTYQPIPLSGFEETFQFSGRACVDRFQAIASRINEVFGDKKLKILDIGCNYGYFVFELAKLGHEVTGLDGNPQYIDVCKFLTTTTEFPTTPKFKSAILTSEQIELLDNYDVVICLSVIHHMKDKSRFLHRLSRKCAYALIEMDGPEYGKMDLETHYYSVTLIADVNDPYGSGHRRRKTWECDNRQTPNLKAGNFIKGRGVFKCNDKVVKRERINVQHSWIRTDLSHEAKMLQTLADTNFFPRFVEYSQDQTHRRLLTEYIEPVGIPRFEEILRFYEMMKHKNLFIIDFVKDMFLFDSQNKLKVIDLESLFDISSRPIHYWVKRNTKSIPYDSYEKQLSYLEQQHESTVITPSIARI